MLATFAHTQQPPPLAQQHRRLMTQKSFTRLPRHHQKPMHQTCILASAWRLPPLLLQPQLTLPGGDPRFLSQTLRGPRSSFRSSFMTFRALLLLIVPRKIFPTRQQCSPHTASVLPIGAHSSTTSCLVICRSATTQCSSASYAPMSKRHLHLWQPQNPALTLPLPNFSRCDWALHQPAWSVSRKKENSRAKNQLPPMHHGPSRRANYSGMQKLP